jgi:hypothetical protein
VSELHDLELIMRGLARLVMAATRRARHGASHLSATRAPRHTYRAEILWGPGYRGSNAKPMHESCKRAHHEFGDAWAMHGLFGSGQKDRAKEKKKQEKEGTMASDTVA